MAKRGFVPLDFPISIPLRAYKSLLSSIEHIFSAYYTKAIAPGAIKSTSSYRNYIPRRFISSVKEIIVTF